MEKQVRWGVLGNAWIARDFMIPAMADSAICSLAAVASRSSVPAEIAPDAVHYDSYEKLLNDPDIDAIYVPVPNALHKQWSVKALQHGKHVLCEKPISCTAGEAEEMVRTAKENQVLLMEAFMYRYGGKFRKMMEILNSGVLGRIRALSGCHGYLLNWASPAREDPKLGGGSLYDVGCYVVDFMNAVAATQGEKPVEGSATFRMKGGVDWYCEGSVRYDGGITGSLKCWFESEQEQWVLIEGERGSLRIPDLFEGNGGELYLTVEGREQVIHVESENPYRLEAEVFSRAILGIGDDTIPLEDSVTNMRTLDMLYGRG